jgi:RNA polymerase sigma factor (sigma-70 family)
MPGTRGPRLVVAFLGAGPAAQNRLSLGRRLGLGGAEDRWSSCPGGYVLGSSFVYRCMEPNRDRLTDRELLALSRDRGSGFGEFYCRHRDAIVAFHGSRVREPELAADLTAETFAAALLVVQDGARELPGQPVAWLFSIAHSKCVDSYRRGQVEADARRRLELERVEVDDQDIARIERVVASTDFLAHLAQQLPADQFDALCARFIEERRYIDIARELRCSPVVVRMRVSRALKALRSTEREDLP